jgi:hypothetical protein
MSIMVKMRKGTFHEGNPYLVGAIWGFLGVSDREKRGKLKRAVERYTDGKVGAYNRLAEELGVPSSGA